MGLVVLQHILSSRTRDRTHVPCVGRWILTHWTTREVPINVFYVNIGVAGLTAGCISQKMNSPTCLLDRPGNPS